MTDSGRINVQDQFLNSVRKQNIPVAIYVTNGYLINGARIISFDNFSVLADVCGKQMLIYKHAISTITPETPVELKKEDDK